MDGALVLDKPVGITSHSAVVAARRLLSEPRIGHLGTLDPLASGVLVLLLGRATRLARFFGERHKSYSGTIRFGVSTTTYDCEGEPTSRDCVPVLSEPELRSLFCEFLGRRLQEPPPYLNLPAQAGRSRNPRRNFEELRDELIRLLKEFQPKSWRDNGGRGTISVMGNALMIRQTCEVHEFIGGRWW